MSVLTDRPYPRDTRRRADVRDTLAARLVSTAEREAALVGRSLTCQDAIRDGATVHGCRNDGTGCICECHDGGHTS